MKPNESLGYPSFPMEQYVVLPDDAVHGNNEIIHNVSHSKTKIKSNAPLLSFGWEDGPDEIKPSLA